jgi:glyoxylase-like metal-dependent hydrolase (beta-lactamase superfamily II)
MTVSIRGFFHEPTFSVSYLVTDPTSRSAAIIDAVLDYDAKSGRTGTDHADAILAAAAADNLTITLILETHVHADHVSAANHLKQRTGAKTAIGAKVAVVQSTFAKLFNLSDVSTDGRPFDLLLREGDRIPLGQSSFRIWETPGHTPACISYLIDDAIFVGDTLFMPDYGTARCDFPGGDPATLYRSIQRMFALPTATRMFLCHDYKAPGRDQYVWETTVGAQRTANQHIKAGIGETDFIAMRRGRDKTLSLPALIIPAVQFNIRAGALPPPESNGVSYLKTPINLL